jgi:hypothetical protein
MEILIIILFIFGVIIGGIFYAFFRTMVWVAEPIAEYFEKDEARSYFVEETRAGLCKIRVRGIENEVFIPEHIIQKAQERPQRLPKIALWIYRDKIMAGPPDEEKG